jgi:hypothetical protein
LTVSGEGSWNDTRGRDLEHFVRSLQPGIIINSRVGRGGGTFGLDGEGGMLGDYATPEQTIPESAIRDIPWETCMTMNGHWGFNAADKNFKKLDRPHPEARRHRKQGRQLPPQRRTRRGRPDPS